MIREILKDAWKKPKGLFSFRNIALSAIAWDDRNGGKKRAAYLSEKNSGRIKLAEKVFRRKSATR